MQAVIIYDSANSALSLYVNGNILTPTTFYGTPYFDSSDRVLRIGYATAPWSEDIGEEISTSASPWGVVGGNDFDNYIKYFRVKQGVYPP